MIRRKCVGDGSENIWGGNRQGIDDISTGFSLSQLESQKFIFNLISKKSQILKKINRFTTALFLCHLKPEIWLLDSEYFPTWSRCSIECHFVAGFHVNSWLFSSEFKRRHYRCRSFVCTRIINLTLSEIFGEWKLDYNWDINSVCTRDAFSTFHSEIIQTTFREWIFVKRFNQIVMILIF